MLRRKKMRKLDQSIDRVSQEMLLALKVSEDEIDAIAATPDLYERVRSRIELRELEGRHTARALPGFAFGFIRARFLRVTLATAAAFLLLAVGAAVLLPKMTQRQDEIARPGSPPDVAASSRETDSGNPPAVPHESGAVAASSTKDLARHKIRRDNRRAEVATDYLPLTFTADAPESGHLVRVRVPRSALIAFGLPMNVDRAGEMVKADVFIGDDGLARAIRFVQ